MPSPWASNPLGEVLVGMSKRYQTTAVEKRFSAKAMVREGEVLGVVGPTGAGKSTLVKLLLRYFEPTGGAILVDGTSLSELTLQSWRGQLGYVPQDAFLFHGTVAENILLGRPEADMDWVPAAIAAERSPPPKPNTTSLGKGRVQGSQEML